jgi:hypothetical protein
MRTLALTLLSTCAAILVAAAQPVLPPDHYKCRVTRRVAERLAVTFGESRPLPRLRLHRAGPVIAELNTLPEPELALGEKVYDLCRTFGRDSLNALSIIVAHELTHYYYHHAGGTAGTPGEGPSRPAWRRELEDLADRQGLVHAFMAGFEPFRLVQPLYRGLYATFRLAPGLKNYPSLEERIRSVTGEADQAGRLGHLYTAGLFLFLRQEYALAERCFWNVAAAIASKELYNNLAVCELQQAVRLLEPHEAPFRYPFELEAHSRLEPGDVRGQPAQARALLREAVKNLAKAIDHDGSYETAYVNLATAYLLLDNPRKAIEKIEALAGALRPAGRQLSANARLVRGMALLRDHRAAEARADFEDAPGAYERAYNYGLYRRYHELLGNAAGREAFLRWRDTFRPPPAPRGTPERRVGTFTLPLPGDQAFEDQFNFPAPNLMRIKCTRTAGTELFRVQLADRRLEFVRALPPAGHATGRGLSAGDAVSRIERLHGKPTRIVPAGAGHAFYCYDEQGLLVRVLGNAVQDWIIFADHP